MKTNLLKSTMVAALAIFGTGVNAQIDTTQVDILGGSTQTYVTNDDFFDIDGDGQDDFYIRTYTQGTTYARTRFYGINGARFLNSPSNYYIGFFEENDELGPNMPSNNYFDNYDYYNYGNPDLYAYDNTDKIIALRFYIDGNLHMGWVKIAFTKNANNSVAYTVKEFAYEMQSMVSIFVNPVYPTSYASTAVTDVASNLNASDLRVDVTPVTSHIYADSVTHAYVMMVKDDGRDFDVNDAMASSFSEEIEFTGAASYSLKLNAWARDTDGDIILQDLPYNVYVGIIDEQSGDVLRLEAPVAFTLKASVDVEELTADKVEVFSTDKTIVINSNLTSGVVNVVDLTGKVIYNGTISSSREEIKLNNATGIYLVNVLSSTSNTTVKVKM